MIIIPLERREDCLMLFSYMEERHIPAAVEDSSEDGEPYLLWILNVPCDPQIEFKWSRRLISEAGIDVSGFTVNTMQFMQENRHKAAIAGRCRFVDPETWASLGHRMPIGCVPPIDIVAFSFHSEQQPTGGVYKPAAATPI